MSRTSMAPSASPTAPVPSLIPPQAGPPAGPAAEGHIPDVRDTPWKRLLAPYQVPSLARSLWQAGSTLLLFVAAWVGLYHTLAISYWLTLALTPIAAGLVVRIFIVHHDCGHGSFFKAPWANHLLGFITGAIAFTSYFRWRHEHALHHASSGNLDNRGVGDVWTLTVDEYLAATPAERRRYRIYRNPFVLLALGPWWEFVIKQRFRRRNQHSREQWGVIWTNLALLAAIGGLSLWIGLKAFLMIQIPIFGLAGLWGIWGFYVQHQFDGALWTRDKDWDYATLSLHGSSYFRMSRIMQWFTGNIGFHHVHHLSSRIPNYRLEQAHKELPFLHAVRTITFKDSVKALRLHLWWEQERRLVGFRDIRHLTAA